MIATVLSGASQVTVAKAVGGGAGAGGTFSAADVTYAITTRGVTAWTYFQPFFLFCYHSRDPT